MAEADGWSTVTGPEDPRLDPIRALPGREQDSDTVVVEGAIAVARALAGPGRVLGLFGTATQLRRLDPGLDPVPTLEVDGGVLRAAMGFDFHRGVVATMQRPARRPAAVDTILARPQWLVLMLERLADPANLGAILRTAAALGVDLVVCDAEGADPYGRRAIRAAMGHSLVRTPWVCDALPRLAGQLGARGGRVLSACATPGALALDRCRRAARTVVLLGNEGHGLSPALAATAEVAVTIPIVPGTDSINVAAAAAIMIYALRDPQGATNASSTNS